MFWLKPTVNLHSEVHSDPVSISCEISEGRKGSAEGVVPVKDAGHKDSSWVLGRL